MSEMDMDLCPRMKTYLRPADLNTDACVTLAAEILQGAAKDLGQAYVRATLNTNRGNLDHLRNCLRFYESAWFTVLTCGAVEDGPGVARQIIKLALRGAEVKT